jgi:peptide deformylase
MSEHAETMSAEPETESGPSEEELRAWRMVALQLVRQYPDPVLKNAAGAVATEDDEVRSLGERMTRIMHAAHGVGLAAPQIGVARRVVVYQLRDQDEVKLLVNPQLVERSDETEVDTEGCLSLLGGELQVPVERHMRVRIAADGLDGERLDYEVEGMEARVIQHEIDHLDGVLILDRAPDEQRRNALRELRLRAV